ncbi:MAG: hypothetical protein J7K04_10915, partial [Spirochaetales bacterium]|nr:hypothetical protein [Spirochaetales bacterium]
MVQIQLVETFEDDSLKVETKEDYFDACKAILNWRNKSINNEEEYLKIQVISELNSVFTWIGDFALKNLKTKPIIEKLTAAEMLRKNWGIDIPEWVNNDDISKYKWYKRVPVGGSRGDFVSVFSNTILGKQFTKEKFDKMDVPIIVKTLSDIKKSGFYESSTVLRILENIKNRWVNTAIKSEKKILEYFFENPESFFELTVTYK